MEEIIGLLVILAVSIFKGVGKKLEQSGKQTGSARPSTPVKPVIPTPADETSSEPFDFEKWVAEAIKEAETEKKDPEPDISAAVEDAVVSEVDEVPVTEQVKPAVAASVRPKAVKPAVVPAVNEENKTDKEKIDPKKLIIYSEIMTPKCMSNN